MDANVLTSSFQLAVANNAGFVAWCVEKYNSEPVVQVGLNLEDPPDGYNYPLVAISFATKRGGLGSDRETLLYAVSFAILDDAAPDVDGKLKTYRQVVDLEEGRQLLVKALASADLDGGQFGEIEVENDPVEFFPIFSTNMAIPVTRPYVFREDKLI
ncbi:hypothetical protein [Desulforhopalus singaporensis]|uniref:Uncharacterized protein n=1 Tax=Desulforhopalus singaporensis TaxID=91360 RepID=A0A1H0NT00_9BACT|nr:hypothetical protein [Desulforhopalus singaporensis]SDO95789.1 hypothetical protein SAMN05660330_01432 [Desulforhopalus singaporensis]